MTKRRSIRLTKVGIARYTYDSPDGTWLLEQYGFPADKAPDWYQFGFSWHLWDPADRLSRLRIQPLRSFETVTKARAWLTEKYGEGA